MSLLRVTWEVTQWERSDLAREGGEGGATGEKGSNYVARECLGCWGAEEAKTEGGIGGKRKKREIITLQFACGDVEGAMWGKREIFLLSRIPSFTDLQGLEM